MSIVKNYKGYIITASKIMVDVISVKAASKTKNLPEEIYFMHDLNKAITKYKRNVIDIEGN